MKRVVTVSNYGLAAKCNECHKSISYPKGVSLDIWARMIANFKQAHKNCVSREGPKST